MGSRERPSVGDNYVLTTGGEGEARLRLMDEVHGPSGREACLARGLDTGWRVADIGCGIGTVACWFAAQVGPDGAVTALDVSADQLAIGRARAAGLGLGNVTFVEGSAYEPGLPEGEFDLVFSRLLLCHLNRPADALARMVALLRPGGALVLQDLVMSAMFSDPQTWAYVRFAENARELCRTRGTDFDIGRRLFSMCRDEGLTDLAVAVDQQGFATGERKRLWELTHVEAVPGLRAAGVGSEEDLLRMTTELAEISRDETILVVHPAQVIVSGIVPGGSVG